MEPLKEMFNHAFYARLSTAVAAVYPAFPVKRFIRDVIDNIEDLSLNQRMRKTSIVLQQHLPKNYTQTIGILKDVVPQLDRGYTTLVFPDFVAQYGIAHFRESIDALKYFTSFGSSEFAIRVFFLHDFQRTLKIMQKWSEDNNFHVRRLSSEGSRPRLPWSFKLDQVIRTPSITAPILQNLKCDEELYVRKSVANHLNDISKDSPDAALRLVNTWDKTHPHTAWILKRGFRSLLKRGNASSMDMFGLTKNVKVSIRKFRLASDFVKLNDVMQFQFDIVSDSPKTQKLMIDYRIHYFKKSGITSSKTFKLKEVTLKPEEAISIRKSQRFMDFSTRQLYTGRHTLEIIVNGKTLKRKNFDFRR